MKKPGKILVVAQHYPPDPTTTAVYVAAIARALAMDNSVLVLSASPGSSSATSDDGVNPQVIEIRVPAVRKNTLIRRAIAVSFLAFRMFLATLRRAQRRDVVFCVTTPFTLPYAAVFAAKLRGAAATLLVYDLYPEALEIAGLIRSSSWPARLLRLANARMFRALDAIIMIGRDARPLLLAYRGVVPDKLHFIPNWTLLPTFHREAAPDNRYRAGLQEEFVVGLSGNLGFTHSPDTVFEAARLIKDDTSIRFMLSGWGVGWEQLVRAQASEQLTNVTLTDAVPESELIDFLAAADVWVIPYRRNVAGVSVPSRLYNLLAIGRTIIVAAEPQSEAALVVEEEGIGWVVAPEDPHQLAEAIRSAAADRAETKRKGRRAAAAAEKYNASVALARYRKVILDVQQRNSPS